MGDKSQTTRIFYMALVPVILVTIILNSGLPQIRLTAASCGGEEFSPVQYHYYYYSCYQEFLTIHAEELSALGYEEKVDAKDQHYDVNTTWEEYFRQEAERRISLAVYYNTMAKESGYRFTAEELAPVQTKLEENRALYTKMGISAKNYYKTYFGPGMTEARYREEYSYEVQAQAYAEYIKVQTPITQKELDAYLTENKLSDYQAATIRMIAMKVSVDRNSNKFGNAQIAALTERLNRLAARLEAEPDKADTYARTYSDDSSAGSGGLLMNQTKSTIPPFLLDWCFSSSHEAGDIATVVDRKNGMAYWACFESYGNSGAVMDAIAEIQSKKAVSNEAAALPDYPVIRNSIGMTVVR